jgi:DNA-directed RNA polymerase subunit RPC12/RpoP
MTETETDPPRCPRCGAPLPGASEAVPEMEVRCPCGSWSVVRYQPETSGSEARPRRVVR